MDREEVTLQFRQIVSDELGVAESRVTDDKTFQALGIDDESLVDILLETERVFNIEPSDTLFDGIDTVGAAIDMIVKKA